MSDVIEYYKDVLDDTDWSDAETNYKVLLTYRRLLLDARVASFKALVMAREQFRLPNYPHDSKDKSTPRYTDFDRTTMLAALTADLQAEYDLVKGLEDLVKERIELCKLLMGANNANN